MRIFTFVLILLAFSFSVQAAEVYGVLMVVKGDVTVVVQKTNHTEKAKVGFKVFPGDTIITGKDSRAKLVMIDKNIINISPNSKFSLDKYVYNPEENKKSVSLNVLYGKVRSTVKQKYDGEQNTYQVKTASAVAGVRGTDFVVSFNETTKVSRVSTFNGRVEVGKGLDKFGHIMSPVFVTPGQFTVASVGTPPSPPVLMQKIEMQTMKDSTDADKAKPGSDSKDRSPANAPKDKSGPGGKLDLNPRPSSMMDMMGDDAARDVASDMSKSPPITIIPAQVPNCPTGFCLPPNINPEYLQGTTKLIINVQ